MQPPPQFQFSSFDPRALLNPQPPLNPQTKRPAQDPASDIRGSDSPATSASAGQYSLVERLHNVQGRTASPAKRPRIDDGTENKPAINHHPSGSGSALNLNGSKQATPAPTPSLAPQAQASAIDLTMSDEEDDVKVMKDNSNQVICIGRPRHLYIQSHMVPFPDPKKYGGNHGHRGRIKVTFRRAAAGAQTNIIMVVDPTGKEFGRIDNISAQYIAPLMDGAKTSGLMWMAWTEPRNRNQDDGPPGNFSSALIGLQMQLYCPRKQATHIGKYLSNKKVVLLDPLWDLARYDYFNPQSHAAFSRNDAAQPNFEAPARYASGAVGANYVLRSVDEIRSDVQGMFDTMINSEEVPTREPSQLVVTKLYKHQKQALWFMCNKEQDLQGEESKQQNSLWRPKYRNTGVRYWVHVITGEEVASKPSSCRGGILADEMGLGKTLSILSLVADDSCLEAAHLFSQMAPAPKGPGQLIQPTTNSRATLLVCPLSTMYNWKSQLEVHFPQGRGLKWINYHGKSRTNYSAKQLADHDLIITTYHMIQADFQSKTAPLPHVQWFRIVLDEAHTIRNANTKQSIAACSLPAQRRWAVTGTPVQNRLEDLGALFKFLHLHPFDTSAGFNHHILTPFKNADPEVVPKLQLLVSSVTLRRVKKNVLDVEIPKRVDSIVRLPFSTDERLLHDWFEADSQRKVQAVTAGDKLGGNSYARILTAITNLRLICAHGRDLLSDEALKMTDGMTYENPVELDDDGEPSGPELSRAQAYDMLDLMDSMDTSTCQYCKENLLEACDSDDEEEAAAASDTLGYMTPCYQVVCAKHAPKLQGDLMNSLQADGHSVCPFCSTRIRPHPFQLSKEDFNTYLEERDRNRRNPKLAKKMNGYTGPSTKTKALLEDLHAHKAWSEDHPDEPPIKSVVFSTWTTHLDLIQLALENERFKYVRLDGRMPREARNRSLTTFDHDNSVHIILVSIGAGGLGLNLTKANKAFVMEPQFNPAAEAQAVDRVHRLGQTREVDIKRFIMENSFEEKMLELQRKKKALADLTMAREKGTKEQAARQRLEDLRSLFK
ncbi:DNA repair protein rad5 [Massarina eburnea CBS 473.64]|uniref:DNA repair protein rad5 n=1 Tax=Massarina eburnea CBS 473.64 TaxID=1395130 RepID=A0A6A6RXF0_9PLEO|nr:DNA repair protein rad5 [Massarina eburnea CBS 473.64]